MKQALAGAEEEMRQAPAWAKARWSQACSQPGSEFVAEREASERVAEPQAYSVEVAPPVASLRAAASQALEFAASADSAPALRHAAWNAAACESE